MPRRGPGAGVLHIENDFHGSGVNRIDSCLFPQSKNQKDGGYSGSHASITITFFTLVKCLKKTRTHTGGQPRSLGFPHKCPRFLDSYYFILALERREGISGQALSAPSPYRCFLFHFLIK
jgi:hypothetical protein